MTQLQETMQVPRLPAWIALVALLLASDATQLLAFSPSSTTASTIRTCPNPTASSASSSCQLLQQQQQRQRLPLLGGGHAGRSNPFGTDAGRFRFHDVVLSQSTKSRVSDAASVASADDVIGGAASGVDREEEDLKQLQSDMQSASTKSSLSTAYGAFAKRYPFMNNIIIATIKTAGADLMAQTVIGGTPLLQVDLMRNLLFGVFGATYLGAFQYFYQVQVFKRIFDVDRFTNQSWKAKLRDGPGLRALAMQTALDMFILTIVYLPMFYVFKASVFNGGVMDPTKWVANGVSNYQMNFWKDEIDMLRVWIPADLLCFSVPLYLRLPVRHIVSFVWTAYISFVRGGH